MKKYLLIAGAGLLITAGVTATALHTGKKKTTTNSSKTCPYHHQCSKAARVACF